MPQTTEHVYLSDVIRYDRDIEPYNFIKIFSGVGSGKSTFACKMIAGDRALNIPKKTVLLITSRRSTVEETLKRLAGEARQRIVAAGNISERELLSNDDLVDQESIVRIIKDKDDIFDYKIRNMSVVCTNAHIESYFKKTYSPEDKTTHIWELFDTVIIDEVHSLVTDATYQSAPYYVMELINEIISLWKEHRDTDSSVRQLILMTGTPQALVHLQLPSFDEQFVKEYNLLDKCDNVVPKIVKTCTRKEAYILINRLSATSGKMIYFSNTVMSKDDVHSKWHISNDINVMASFSTSNKKVQKEICEEIDALHDGLAETCRLPENCKLFVTTSRNKEGINIQNENISCIFVESHFLLDAIQMSGRARTGTTYLYIVTDAPQYDVKVNQTEIDFAKKGLVSHGDLDVEDCGYTNAFLKNCTDYGSDQVLKAMNGGKPICQCSESIKKYIEYVHNTFDCIRYSFVRNRFEYYAQREISRRYETAEQESFNHATITSSDSLKALLNECFPFSAVDVFPYPNERCKLYIESLLGKRKSVKLTLQQYNDILKELSRIYGQTVAYPNTKLAPLKYCISERNSRGYYWLHRGTSKSHRSMGWKKSGKKR